MKPTLSLQTQFMYLLYSAQHSWINVIRYECGTVFVVFWSYTEQSFCQMLLEVWWQTVCQRKCSSHRRNKMSTDVSHWLYSSQPGDCAFSCNHSQSGVGCPKLFHLSFLSLSVGNQMRFYPETKQKTFSCARGHSFMRTYYYFYHLESHHRQSISLLSFVLFLTDFMYWTLL